MGLPVNLNTRNLPLGCLARASHGNSEAEPELMRRPDPCWVHLSGHGGPGPGYPPAGRVTAPGLCLACRSLGGASCLIPHDFKFLMGFDRDAAEEIVTQIAIPATRTALPARRTTRPGAGGGPAGPPGPPT